MTAYLQRGDKIHITVPGDWGSRAVGQRKLEDVKAAYEKLGIIVFLATPVIHSEQVEVVCVIRDWTTPRERVRRSPEKLNLIDEAPDPVRWDPLTPPWMSRDQ